MSSSSSSESSMFDDFPDLSYFGKTLNGTFVLVYNNSLFYKKQGQNIVRYATNVKKAEVWRDSVVVLYDQNNWTKSFDLEVIKENFHDIKKIFVKDKAFDIDQINNYLKYTKRIIKDFYITDGELFVIFGDDEEYSVSSISMSSFSSLSSESSTSSLESQSSSQSSLSSSSTSSLESQSSSNSSLSSLSMSSRSSRSSRSSNSSSSSSHSSLSSLSSSSQSANVLGAEGDIIVIDEFGNMIGVGIL